MNRQLQCGMLAALMGLAGVQGCEHASQRSWSNADGLPSYSPYLPPPGPVSPAPAPGVQQTLPPPSAPAAEQMRSYQPPGAVPVAPNWQPAPGGSVRLAPPETMPEPPRVSAADKAAGSGPGPGQETSPQRVAGAGSRPGPGQETSPERVETAPQHASQDEKPRLKRDQQVEKKVESGKTADPGTVSRQPGSSPAVDAPASAPPLPVGIPQFASVQDQVTAGLKPHLDGLDWLGDNGYRTVLRVRQPGEEDAADRRLVELRGMKFQSLEIAPQSLTRKQVEAFNQAVADPALRPLFVYDEDGSLAGPLWYLYFRTAGHLPDEEARTKAESLGLNLGPKSNQQVLWLAVQKYLGEQK
jgi:protein tyrosine phosphatase (PTP) superfamily phosphohydrolase (DUF442 family)